MQSTHSQKVNSGQTRSVKLSLAHSPDSDDAFMFYALATRKIRTGNLRFSHTLEDIESLNQKALEGIFDITAMSFHAYAYLADRYLLLPSGGSFGDRYGPLVVTRGSLTAQSLRGRRIAVPGKLTTAYLAMKLYEPEFEPVFVPFDRILGLVASGEVDAGVLIHEGQLTYAREGVKKVVDLGEWWHRETELPLPLGGNGIKRSLDTRTLQQAAKLLRESIQYGLNHREEALEYAVQFARGLDPSTADRFVSLYVNDWTLNYGERGRQAIQALLDRGFERGVLPRQVIVEFVE
ncbi:MAG: ABC transporter substrate-binding protein [Acidobacteria bacterium]|nr:ABC transporter substrate-binding protein [Acidobacteriota bacterium]MBI1983868.1 ABC transporter substrate-binding protein [Acidobacteriota bacterium]